MFAFVESCAGAGAFPQGLRNTATEVSTRDRRHNWTPLGGPAGHQGTNFMLLLPHHASVASFFMHSVGVLTSSVRFSVSN